MLMKIVLDVQWFFISKGIVWQTKGALTKFTYEYGVNGAVNFFTWNGTLANSEKKAMTVPFKFHIHC
jgi:hypothetical protein